MLTVVFEKYFKVSKEKFRINFLYCVSSPSYTWDCGLKHTGFNIERIQDVDLSQKFENGIRGGIGGVTCDRFIKSDFVEENETKVLYVDQNILYVYAMLQYLRHKENKTRTYVSK